MKKHLIFLFAFTILVSTCASVSYVYSQPESIKVLSYNWYLDSLGYFIVVGEIQNIGPNTVDSVVLSGTVYTIDGTAQAYSYTQAYARYLLPQQKAPFYMEFFSEDLSWLSIGVDRVDFLVNQANATGSYQYPYLTITDSSGSSTADGVYWVSGTLQNIGNQTSRDIRVFGTFYNASGSVVGVGYSDLLSPASLGPSGTASFRLGAFDVNQTEVPSSFKISGYSLLVQAQEPILSGTAPPVPPPSDPTNSTSPSNPADLHQNLSFSRQFLYVAISAAVVIGIVAAALILRKQKSPPAKNRKRASSRKKK